MLKQADATRVYGTAAARKRQHSNCRICFEQCPCHAAEMQPESRPTTGVGAIGEPIDIMNVGFTRACLASPYAKRLTESTVYVDGGLNIVA